MQKVGGPVALGLITAGVGYVTGRIGEAGVKKVYRKVKGKIHSKTNPSEYPQMILEVMSYGKDSKGVIFNVGDSFRILESDGDAILIEIIGNTDNPHFVSCDFLRTISNFEGGL